MAEDETTVVVESPADDEIPASIADEDQVDDAGSGGAEGGKEVDAAVDDAAGKQGEPDKPAEPEPYELTVDEDFPLPAENLKSFTEAAQKTGLTKEQAQAMLGWHKGFHSDVAKLQEQQAQQTILGWQKALLADPEFGGEHYKQTVANGRLALKKLDPDGELRSYLKQMKVDFHPAVVKAIARAGAMMREDKFIGGSGGGGRENLPLYERLYPSNK